MTAPIIQAAKDTHGLNACKILTITLNPALDIALGIESLQPGMAHRARAPVVHAAGKGINVAQVLADLGHHITVSGFLGSENTSEFEALFARRSFRDEFIRVPGRTRSNINLIEEGGQVTSINAPGMTVTPPMLDLLMQRLDRIAPGHDAIVIAGSLATGMPAEWLGSLITRLKQHVARVALDTSGAALIEGVRACPWLIKPNINELAELCGEDPALLSFESPDNSDDSRIQDSAGMSASSCLAVEVQGRVDQLARQLQGLGIPQVVVSQGRGGVRWYAISENGFVGSWLSTPPAVKVASTLGAGDSLLAGMVHGLLTGQPPQMVLRNATAIAAMVVTQNGCGISDPVLLGRLRQDVQVETLPLPAGKPPLVSPASPASPASP